MAIRLKIKLENGVKIDTIINDSQSKKIEKLKSYKVIANENSRRFRAYQKGKEKFSKLPYLETNKRLNQLTVYIKDLKRLED